MNGLLVIMKSIGIALSTKASEDNKNIICPKDKLCDNISKDLKKDKSDVELHINIWKLRGGWFNDSSKFYIDFGLMVHPPYNKICLCLPFKLQEKESWQDLGEKICNNDELLRALFNEEYSATCQSNSCYYGINDPESAEKEGSILESKFYFYILGSQNVTISEGSDEISTRFEIDIHDLSATNGKDYYIRFRLFLKDSGQFCKTRNLSNDFLQSAFSKLDLYDLRINQKKDLDKKDKEYIKVNQAVLAKFSKIHVLYIASTKVSVENESIHKIDGRIIEPDLWKDYEPTKLNQKLCIAHHWKSSKKDNQDFIKIFNLFFIAKYPKIHLVTLMSYLAVVLLLGALGSWLSNITLVNGDFDQFKLWLLGILLAIILISWLWNYKIKFIILKKEP